MRILCLYPSGGGVYDPVSADPIKWAKGFDNEFLETHKKEFIRIYFEMFLQNPKEYMEAFIAGTLGFWNYEQSTWVICAWGPVEAALETGIQSDQGIFKWNRIRYNESVGVLQSEIPLVKLILRGGFLFWMAFFSAVRVIVEREYKKLLPLLPLFGLWATLIIASPLYSSFRYMFSFEIAIPIFLYMFLYSTKSRRIGAKG